LQHTCFSNNDSRPVDGKNLPFFLCPPKKEPEPVDLVKNVWYVYKLRKKGLFEKSGAQLSDYHHYCGLVKNKKTVLFLSDF